MLKYDLDRYIKNPKLVEDKVKEFIKLGIIKKQYKDEQEIQGHLLKSNHNLDFVLDAINLGYLDWAITGCYYAAYHAALSLIITRGYSSKNHLATLLILIQEFYENGLDKDDIRTFISLLDYQDILFYVESKNKREDATYSTKTIYTKKEVEDLRLKSVLFVSKVKEIMEFS